MEKIELNKPLILASGSPRRQFLLKEAGYDFEVCVSGVDEWDDPEAKPDELVLHNARLKAEDVSAKLKGKIILASDTTVSIGGHVLNKPSDMSEAKSMIRRLSGKTHSVFTAVVIIDGDRIDEHCVESQVCFKELSDSDIDHYFTIVNPLDKAGAYGIQEGKEIIIDHFEGSFTNIMGLPMELIEELFV